MTIPVNTLVQSLLVPALQRGQAHLDLVEPRVDVVAKLPNFCSQDEEGLADKLEALVCNGVNTP